MNETTPIVERAFQLARSGKYQHVTQVKLALKREGYGGAESHVSGRSIVAQLKLILSETYGSD
jgi:hypothetical protein